MENDSTTQAKNPCPVCLRGEETDETFETDGCPICGVVFEDAGDHIPFRDPEGNIFPGEEHSDDPEAVFRAGWEADRRLADEGRL